MYFAGSTSLSPSTKFVLKILQLNGRMTQKEIVVETTLPPRTVKYAIKKLKESDIVRVCVGLGHRSRTAYVYERPR